MNLESIAKALPDNVTGADLGAVSAAAFSIALQRKLKMLEQAALELHGFEGEGTSMEYVVSSYVDSLTDEELTCVVSQDDFTAAIKTLKPSVSMVELQRYVSLGKELDSSAEFA